MILRILPGWLYSNLPLLYILAGIVTILLAGNVLGRASGAVLVLAGVLVFLMRRSARRAQRSGSRRRSPATLQRPDAPPEKAMQAKWDGELECGHAVIDRQHRDLVVRANELLLALGGRGSRADIELLLDELIENLEEHFRTEEGIAVAEAHADLEEHRQAHRELLAKAGGLLADFQGGRPIGAELGRFIAEDVLAGHVAREREVFSVA